MNKIVVQEKDFDLSTEVALAQANDGNIGAVVSFVGLVREHKTIYQSEFS
jgi:molybdopterin synthase catalytic subunit